MNHNLLNINLLLEHTTIALVIALVVIVVSVSLILFKYFVRHHKDKDKE